jgi:type I restriction enzyme M protein
MAAKMKGNNSINELEKTNWNTLNSLRGSIDLSEFHFILYFLILKREGVLEDFTLKKTGDVKNNLKKAVYNYEGRYEKDLKNIYNIFEPVFVKIEERIFFELINSFSSIKKTALDANLITIFDNLLFEISKNLGKSGRSFIQPAELSRFICNVAELPKNAVVYNPFAGAASFGIQFGEGVQYIGQEIDIKTWAIAKLRLIAHGKSETSNYFLGDSVINWNPSSISKFDLIVTNPPFNVRNFSHQSENFGNIRSYEHYIIDRGLKDLKYEGKLIVVVRNSFLSQAGNEQLLRKEIVSNDLLDAVISFPGGLLLDTSIPFSVIILNKKKARKGYVQLVNAENYVESVSKREKIINDKGLLNLLKEKSSADAKLVSNSEIASRDYNLNVSAYYLDTIVGASLGDLVSVIRGTRVSEKTKGKFIRIRDLKDDKMNYVINLNEIESIEVPKTAVEISEACLILATRWNTLKPSFVFPSDDKFSLIPDTIALKVDESKVDIAYLVNELHSDYVAKQIQSFSSGGVVPFIKKDDLLRIKIKVLPLSEQKALIRGAAEGFADEKKRELNLFKKIHGLETELVEQNTYLRHALAGPASNLKGFLENLKLILEGQVLPKIPNMMSLKISDKHELTFGGYLESIEESISRISDTVSKQIKVETVVDDTKLEPIDILAYLKKRVAQFRENKNYDFKIEFDFDVEYFIDENGKEKAVFIMGNAQLLDGLFDNLIDNAIRHGFENNDNSAEVIPGGRLETQSKVFNFKRVNRIEISLFGNLEGEIQILFSNTGAPFPPKFTFQEFIRKGLKSGRSAGNGFGGWYINEIIKKLNGNFDIIDETGEEGFPGSDLATSFEINLPLIDVNETI